ncbi:MAG: DUF5335 family protein [Pyrinomonadaceae bacterium]
MKTRQIPRNEWTRFFDNLSRRQEGWEVELEVFGPEIGSQVEGCHLFLAGIVAELRDDSDKGDKIEIMMAGKPNAHITHVIANPILVELQQTDLGIDSALHLKSADGTTSLLHLS